MDFMWGLVLWLGALALVVGMSGGLALGLFHWYLYVRSMYEEHRR